MKSRMVAIAALVVLLAVQGALGSITVNDDIRIDYWSAKPSGQSQGPFYAVIYDHGDSSVGLDTSVVEAEFLTFCVERTQYFSPGARYNIEGISDHSSVGKTLTGYTSWVYDKFRGYGWDNTNGPTGTNSWGITWGTVMDLYQQAIWAGMVGTDGIVGSGAGGAVGAEYAISDWSDYEEIAIGLTSFQNSGWTGLQGYRVMNLGKDGTNYQDHLLPPGGWTSTIPEPASLAIWSLIGLTFAAVWWRRRKSSLSN